MYAPSAGEPTRHRAACRHANSQTAGLLREAALRHGSVRTKHTLIYPPLAAVWLVRAARVYVELCISEIGMRMCICALQGTCTRTAAATPVNLARRTCGSIVAR